MLSQQDNDLLCRVGPGTTMGNMMREYWIPAARSDELPSPDCPPLRVRLLGEDLIAFRVTSGEVGLMQNSCPHRGASMFFGRNEEEGLRCVYHGWKFDVNGNCIDMPSEPAESNFKSKVHARSYPAHERGSIIWAYMGPRETPPPLPDFEANMLADGGYAIYNIFQECNYMQGWEGEMDTVHQAFLHFGSEQPRDIQPGTAGFYIARHRDAKFSVIDTEFGCSYGAYRPAEDDTYYWRIAHQMLPFWAMIPTGTLGLEIRSRAYVPIDDDHTMMWTITGRNGDRPGREGLRGTEGTQRAGGQPGIQWMPERLELAWPLPHYSEPRPTTSASTASCSIPAELLGHPRRRPAAGHGRDLEHGHHLQPLPRAPGYHRPAHHPHPSPHAPSRGSSRAAGHHASRRRQP